VILPELYYPDRGYALATIWQNLQGVFETRFFCGHDLELAIEFANELNISRGHDPDFVTECLNRRTGLSNIYFHPV